ncbi:MAG: phosphoribosylformimino-5-aminoimidazole carboxamide ribotide isomerase [Lachnospiraceae bacterium]|jgi:phosphoribosylformimino-5-aminoimidazole carboxamide ribotide isomerase|nr:phosphoribosylformimino-5-aminoimidazole carboxamide ribotide isomerase [Lachnospiraceae bacterium]
MEFRPCIDIHNGKVKQIVGSSLTDSDNKATENFVADSNASFFACLYKKHNLKGGHIILLNPVGSEYYEATKAQALDALKAFPGGMQIGGGITPDTAKEFLDAGATHVIVTSYVFKDGMIKYDNLRAISDAVGKERLVLDLSCKKTADGYKVVTDRWQKMSDVTVDLKLLENLSDYCDEYLVHAVDVEGKNSGIEEDLVRMLAKYDGKPITYAGGVHSYEDIKLLKTLGKDKINMTIGSALDLFGGSLSFEEVLQNY